MEQLRKKFVRFKPHVYEECRFLQDCDKSGNGNCNICRVILMRDRFLGEKLCENIELKRNVNPYILLVDSAGCNSNCWFCYAHEMIKPEDYNRLEPVFNTPAELAHCFMCKMIMSEDLLPKDKDRFFSRIRITGGEPLFSTDDTLINRGDRSHIEATIDYYLGFFKEMDGGVRDLLKDGVISLAEIQKYSPTMKFPTWLATKPNRINIRFDTNGLLFSKKESARRFVEGVADCDLKNLRIEIDYSLKGATPIEYKWASHNSLPVDDAEVEPFDIKNHPQYSGLINIIEMEEEMKDKLGDCFSLTVERGINHGKSNGFVNSPRSLNWTRFLDNLNRELRSKELTEIELSDVDNPIQYAKQWGYLFGRYHSRGAGIRVRAGSATFDYLPWDAKDKETVLIQHIRNYKDKHIPYELIFFPCERDKFIDGKPSISEAEDTREKVDCKTPRQDLELRGKAKKGRNVWILTGKLRNWEFSVDNSVWGVKEKHKELWDLLDIDDSLFFYVSKPVGGLIGCGEVSEKFYNKQLIWKDEIETNASIYPYKLRFNKAFIVPRKNWVRDSARISGTSIPFIHGINLVEDVRHKEVLQKIVESNWKLQ